MNLNHFYKQNYADRLAILQAQLGLDEQDLELIARSRTTKGDQIIENYLTDFSVPEGVAVNFLINGQEKVVPMVTEEPSVIAAASHGAKMTLAGGGIQVQVTERLICLLYTSPSPRDCS